MQCSGYQGKYSDATAALSEVSGVTYLQYKYNLMEHRVFYVVIDCRGHHRKDITIYNAAYVNLHQNVLFN
jgi:hypothetical protein